MQSLAYLVYVARSHLCKLRDGVGHSSSPTSVDEVLTDYIHKEKTYVKIHDLMNKEMDKGLSRSEHADATVKMFISYVQSLPDGSETGDYLALDLGGTNFRVLLISLKGSNVDMKNKIYPIAEELMLGTGTQLFDYIASCIAGFVREHHLETKSLPLGFTFSFPCRQEGLAVGKLVTWSKGFKCSGVEGKDVVALLHEAIKRNSDVDVECVAILNDTVGCLMSCAFLDHNAEIGVILGTGTNACYVEKLDRVQRWNGSNAEPRQVVINTEWGAFGDNGVLDFVRTQVDRDVDSESLNPGQHLYEKLISGMYMGEIARRIIVQCVSLGCLFNGQLTEEINTPHRFYTKYVSEIEKDEDDGEFLQTKEILDELGINNVTIEDCRNVRKICKAVSERAAYLASAGIAVLVNRISKPKVTVAVDGSLYRFHPHFHKLMMTMTTSLIKPGIDVKLMLSEDGSGKGAALVAAVAYRLSQARKSVSS